MWNVISIMIIMISEVLARRRKLNRRMGKKQVPSFGFCPRFDHEKCW